MLPNIDRKERGTPDRHKLIWLILAIVFLSAAVLLFQRGITKRTPVRSHEGTVLGSFWVPPLPGWRKDLYQDNRLSNVKYSITKESAVVVAIFTLWKTQDDNQAPTIQSLKRDVDSWIKSEKSTQQDGVSKIALSSKPTLFQSWSGYITDVTRYKGEEVTVVKYLHFIDGKNKYMLSVAVRGIPPFVEATKSQEQAWQSITQGLRVHHDST